MLAKIKIDDKYFRSLFIFHIIFFSFACTLAVILVHISKWENIFNKKREYWEFSWILANFEYFCKHFNAKKGKTLKFFFKNSRKFTKFYNFIHALILWIPENNLTIHILLLHSKLGPKWWRKYREVFWFKSHSIEHNVIYYCQSTC